MPPPIIAVHGFQFDPKDPQHDPFRLFLPPIAAAVGVAAHNVTLWAWYSFPVGLRHVLTAWGEGHWNRYRAAWAAAQDEGEELAMAVRHGGLCRAPGGGPVDLVAHSLGAELARVAVAAAPAVWRRVVLFAGAAQASA